jgi:Tol biopolymer transport system component
VGIKKSGKLMRKVLSLAACFMGIAGITVGDAAEPQSNNVQVVLVDMQGHKTVLGDLPDSVVAPRVAPDGEQVTFELTDPPASATAAQSSKVYVADLDKLDKRRALPQTIIEPRNLAPVWSPDEQWVVFQGSGNGSDDLYQARVIANITEQPLYIGDGLAPQSIDRNGRVTFLTLKGDKDYGIAQLDPRTRKVTRLVDQPGSAQYSSSISPDGRWIAYASDETGRPEVWLEPLPISGKRLQLTKNGGSHPQWSPDGAKLYFDQDDQMFQLVIATGGDPKAGDPVALPIKGFRQGGLRRQYDLTPDGKGFVMLFPQTAAGN